MSPGFNAVTLKLSLLAFPATSSIVLIGDALQWAAHGRGFDDNWVAYLEVT